MGLQRESVASNLAGIRTFPLVTLFGCVSALLSGRYGGWVIAAVNADMPFDQFTIEQLAGDLLPEAGTGDTAWDVVSANGGPLLAFLFTFAVVAKFAPVTVTAPLACPANLPVFTRCRSSSIWHIARRGRRTRRRAGDASSPINNKRVAAGATGHPCTALGAGYWQMR